MLALFAALFLLFHSNSHDANADGSQTFTSSGTFTVPDYSTLTVTVNGAGGGGGGGASWCNELVCGANGTAGGGGGNSTFNSNVVGNGGGGGGGGNVNTGNGAAGSAGTASGGDTNTTGGGAGGGGGGAGGAPSPGFTPLSNGGSGGAGGKAIKTYSRGDLTVGASISVAVGTGGSAGAAGSPGFDAPGSAGSGGSSGSVSITWTSPTTRIIGNVKIASNLNVRGSVSKGSGTFAIDHPTSPRTKLLYHSFVESPEAKNIYDGVAKLNVLGEATIQLPEYFEALNEDFRYQYFPLHEPMPGLYIKKEIKNNEFTIAGGAPRGEVSWQVTGIRHDPYIIANPIRVEIEKGPGELVDKGEYVFPEYEQFTPTSQGAPAF